MKQTYLNSIHKSLNAKMVDFSGWQMPLQYSGVITEHNATRNCAGLFDISHMGEIFIEGPRDLIVSFLEAVTCNLISSIKKKSVQYNVILNENGGIVDDVTIYNIDERKILICCNASNIEKVFNYLVKLNQNDKVKIINASDDYNQLAIQGPKADAILSKYLKQDLSYIPYYGFDILKIENEDVIISRTGYTGEDGFEIYSTHKIGEKFWNELLEIGNVDGILPVGLACRDLLRIEARYPLYGNELNDDRTPSESALSWLIKEKEIPFFQYEKILSEKKDKTHNMQIMNFEMLENGIPRDGFILLDDDLKEIGKVTSGIYSPILKKGIGFGIINRQLIKDDFEFFIKVRSNTLKAKIRKTPFIKGSIKKGKL